MPLNPVEGAPAPEPSDEPKEGVSGDNQIEQGGGGSSRGRRRRVFRQGTNPKAEAAHYTESIDTTGRASDPVAAGGSAEAERTEGMARDRWLEEQRPPHYE